MKEIEITSKTPQQYCTQWLLKLVGKSLCKNCVSA